MDFLFYGEALKKVSLARCNYCGSIFKEKTILVNRFPQADPPVCQICEEPLKFYSEGTIQFEDIQSQIDRYNKLYTEERRLKNGI